MFWSMVGNSSHNLFSLEQFPNPILEKITHASLDNNGSDITEHNFKEKFHEHEWHIFLFRHEIF